jgi:hypothetical protein
VHFISQGSHITLMPLKTQTMVHHILRGRPLRTRIDIHIEEGQGKGKTTLSFSDG